MTGSYNVLVMQCIAWKTMTLYTSFIQHRNTIATSQYNNIVPGEGRGEGSSTAQTDQGKKGSEVAGHGYSIKYILYTTIVRGCNSCVPLLRMRCFFPLSQTLSFSFNLSVCWLTLQRMTNTARIRLQGDLSSLAQYLNSPWL